jgi:hypothetical protein
MNIPDDINLKSLQIDIQNIKDKKKINKCISLFKKAYDTGQLTENFYKIVEKRRKNLEPYNICKNKKSVGNNRIELYNKEDLLFIGDIDNNIYCFDKQDIQYLKKYKRNPFTGNEINNDIIESLHYDDTIPIYPLDEAIEFVFGNKHCPIYVKTTNFPIVTDVVYYMPIFTVFSPYRSKIKEIKSLKELPDDKILVSTNFYSSVAGIPSYIYKITLKEKIAFPASLNYLHNYKKSIKSFETIYNPTTRETEKIINGKKLLDSLLYNEIRDYVEKNIQIRSKYVNQLKKLKIIPKKVVKVYRGLAWDETDIRKPNNIKIGDEFPLVSDIQQSWSTNICTATAYAKRKRYGIILSCILKPQQILLDIRQVNITDFINQSEIISLPGVFECRIEKILYTEQKSIDGLFGRDDLKSGWLY